MTDDSVTAEQLVETILNGGDAASDATLVCGEDPEGEVFLTYGVFTGGSSANLPFESGIILSSEKGSVLTIDNVPERGQFCDCRL